MDIDVLVSGLFVTSPLVPGILQETLSKQARGSIREEKCWLKSVDKESNSAAATVSQPFPVFRVLF